jgi:presenilin-like A22 family membrane protease
MSDMDFLKKPSVYKFKAPVPPEIAQKLLQKIIKELMPELVEIHPDFSLYPLYDNEKNLAGIDFFVTITPELRTLLYNKLKRFIMAIHNDLREGTSDDDKFTSFTELLGTYRTALTRFYVPIVVCVICAMFLAWLTTTKTDVVINAAMIDPEESTTTGIILNGLVPVLISAMFITIIYFLVKKFGMKVFKYIMGGIVLFYNWFGFMFFVEIAYEVAGDSIWVGAQGWFYFILYYVLMGASALFFMFMGWRFFKGKSEIWEKNLLVLLFGIFLGTIFGISLPTWSLFMFIIFLSIWDLIAVFKGPLGKISELIMDNRKDLQEKLKARVESGEITEAEAEELGYTSVHDEEMDDEDLKDSIKDVEIELGSGDLILYSALIAHVFIISQNWIITIFVIVGVFVGIVSTLYILFKKRKVLPALPMSMFLGVILFFLGSWVVSLI